MKKYIFVVSKHKKERRKFKQINWIQLETDWIMQKTKQRFAESG